MSFSYVAFQPSDLQAIPEDSRPRLCADSRGVTALETDNSIAAVAVFDSWTQNSCMFHIYIANSQVLRRGYPQEIFSYVFITANRGVIVGATPTSKPDALKLCKHVGFTEIARLNDAYAPNDDMVITELRRENCRWIPEEYRYPASEVNNGQ